MEMQKLNALQTIIWANLMIKTPETDPNHHTIGQYFKAGNGIIYYCDSYDTNLGYWMTGITNLEDRRNVSERAIGRTFHVIEVGQYGSKNIFFCQLPITVDEQDLLLFKMGFTTYAC
jgi:hypothetical protein